MNSFSTAHPRREFVLALFPFRPRLGRALARVLSLAALLVGLIGAGPVAAQSGNARIEGRVKNAVTGEFLNNARVAVKGTNLVAFTDESGSYRIDGVPAGAAVVRVFFTGFDEQEITVNVAVGQTATADVGLKSKALYGAQSETVQLDPFTVQSTRETNAAVIAVNEQRFASNITSVVSTDEFGTIVDRNPGEILKFLPGVDVEYFANNITGVSVRGLGANNTELNFDGMPVASMNAESVGRAFEVQYGSAADIARVEIRKVPLPEDSANSLGGSINMIRKSAFEYSKRRVTYQVLFKSDGEKLTLKDMDGPKDRGVARWQPNWEVGWVEPINRNLGFAFTLGQNNTVVNTHWSLPGWDTGSTANDTAAEAALAAGQPFNRPSLFTPGIRNPLNHNAPKQQGKDYVGLRVDWRPQPALTLGWSLNAARGWVQNADDIRYRWDNSVTGSGDRERFVDRTTSLGRVGGGGVYHDNPLWRDVASPSLSTVFESRWRKDAWTLSARGGWSVSRYSYFDTEHGFFNSTSVASVTGLTNVPETGVGANTANPIPLTINYRDIGYWAPKQIEVFTTTTGAASTNIADYAQPVDWWKNSVIRLGGARSRPGASKEIVTAAKTFARRQFSFETPFSAQLGFDYTERFRNRRYDSYAWRFVGADGVPNSPDDAATLIAADNLPARRDSVYDYPAIERLSMSKYYSLFQQHPTWFQYDAARSARLSLTQQAAYDLTETIVAPYAQFDWQLLQNRLRLTGGVRHERTKADARGLLHVQSDAYQKYSDGTVRRSGDVVGPNGLPTTRAGNPVYLPGVTQGSLAETQLTYVAKGASGHGKNNGTFPSLHATYRFTENFHFQLAYARTQSRLDFANVVVPSNDITDTPVTSGTGTGALGTINIRNPNLKPETVDNFDSRLTYYNNTGGLLGVGLFRKNIQDFQVALVTPPMSATDLTAFEAQFPEAGIGPEYAGYSISSRFNGGAARLDGAELELKQSLDRFLPAFARGLLVRGSIVYVNRSGERAGDLGNDRALREVATLSFHRRKFSLNINYTMNGELIENATLVTNGRNGRQVLVPQHLLDFSLTYALTKWANLFIQGSNITNELRAREQQFKERPVYASMTSSNTFGKTFTIGITGSFGDVPFRMPWDKR